MLLDRASAGDERALDDLWDRVYQEVHAMATACLRREREGCTLEATEAVSEVYLKVFERRCPEWENRRHFFGSIARAMGQLLIDHARRRQAGIRGGGWARVSLDLADAHRRVDAAKLGGAGVPRAIERLAAEHPRAGDVAGLRFLMGLSVAQTAAALDVSERTVKSDWRFARAWLERELHGSEQDGRVDGA